ncbi:hypothetical protein DEU53_1177 [Pantoea sp. AG1095]|nr:hypothetical protein DEU53_1177 [Pantoea sp. AG1095]
MLPARFGKQGVNPFFYSVKELQMNTRYPDYTLDTDRASRENGSTAYIALDNSTYVIEQTATKTLSSFPESLVSDTPVSYAHQPSSYAYGVKAITPVIRYAWDDVGQEQGVRASGNRTDDAAPTLRGTGPANTYMDIMFTNGSVTRYNGITTDADGNWSWTPRADLADGTWTFKVQADGQDTWSNAFTLIIETPAAPDALITHIYDNVGSEQGERFSGSITDDAMPTLHGTGPANTLIDILYTDGGRVRTNSTFTDNEGNWSWTPWQNLNDGYWTFQVQVEGAPSWSQSFAITIDTPEGRMAMRDAEISHITDNVGSDQGDLYSGSITDDALPTLHGTGPANTLIDILYTDGGRVRTNSTFTDNEGNWSWTPWQNLNDGYWTFQVQVEGAPSWSQSFAITIDTSANTASGDDAFDNALTSLSFGDLLSVVDSDVLIDNGKTQYMLDSDANNVVKLEDILSGNDIDGWQQQQGTLTVAGIQYDVYQYTDETELLVQHAV